MEQANRDPRQAQAQKRRLKVFAIVALSVCLLGGIFAAFVLISASRRSEVITVTLPSRGEEKKAQTGGLVAILVPSASKEAEVDEDNKVFICFAGAQDSTSLPPKVKELILSKAVSIYNEQNPDNQISLSGQQVKTFVDLDVFGTPFKYLPDLLNMPMDDIEREQGDLENPNAGIPVGDSSDSSGTLNDFQVWCRAICDVVLDDLYADMLEHCSAPIAVMVDKDARYKSMSLVLENLNALGVTYIIMQAPSSEEENAPAQ